MRWNKSVGDGGRLRRSFGFAPPRALSPIFYGVSAALSAVSCGRCTRCSREQFTTRRDAVALVYSSMCRSCCSLDDDNDSAAVCDFTAAKPRGGGACAFARFASGEFGGPVTDLSAAAIGISAYWEFGCQFRGLRSSGGLHGFAQIASAVDEECVGSQPLRSARTSVWSGTVRFAAALVVGLMLGCSLAFMAHAQANPDAENADLPLEWSTAAEERLQDVLEALPALLLASRWPEAIALVESSPLDSADALALQGFVLLRSDSPELARVAFLEALEARPERLGIWLYVAQCSVALGDAAAAQDAYQRGLPAGRDVSAVWILGAQIEALGGHGFRAWDVLAAAEDRFGPLPDADVLRTQIVSRLDVRWTMIPWQMTRAVGLPEACRWWSEARTQDQSAGLPTQGRIDTSRRSTAPLSWVGTTGLWANACEPGLRRIRSVRDGLTFLQGVGDSGPDDRMQRLAQSGECERALALGAIYADEVTAETQPWLNWCSSLQ